MKFRGCHWGLYLSVVGTLGCPAPVGASTPWPEFPLPNAVRAEWVSRMSWVNGLPTQVLRFDTDQSPDQILAFYKAFWRSLRGDSPSESRHDRWQLVAHVHGPFQTVVQVQPGDFSGSRVMVSRVNFLEVKKTTLPRSWSAPAGLVVHHVMESIDAHRRSFYITAQANQSASWLCEHLPVFWRGQGWRLGGQVEDQKACVMNLARSGSQLEVLIRGASVAPHERSYVVIQWLEEFNHEKR